MHLGKKLYSLLLFILVSILGGLLVAGLLVPGATAVGAGGAAISDAMLASPEQMDLTAEMSKQAQRSQLLNADGTVLANFYDENRVNEPLSKIATIMQQAQIAIEDTRFYQHGAIDLRGTMRALVSNANGVSQGGSDLTQQLVRTIQIEDATANGDQAAVAAAKAPTLARKIKEMRLAMAVEKQYSKDDILDAYLNISYYGDGAYGVQAAARHFFNVDASKLTLPEAAMLAGLVQNPSAYNPRTHTTMALQRRNIVLDRMAQVGVITPADAATAKATSYNPAQITSNLNGCASSNYPFICSYAVNELTDDNSLTSLGSTPDDRLSMIYRGGLTIKTDIDMSVQNTAQTTIANSVLPLDPVIAVVVMLDPTTGQIIAMAQSRGSMIGTNGKMDGPGASSWNYAVDHAPSTAPYNGGAQGYQAGSTFKAFTIAAALSNGTGAGITFNAASPMVHPPNTYSTCNGPTAWPLGSKGTKWDPVNDPGPRFGNISMATAAKNSVNTYFVQLETSVGVCNVVKMAQTVGLTLAGGQSLLGSNPNQQVPSFTLGTSYVSPLAMAGAYATFANGGIHCTPVMVTSITSASGKSLPAPNANCQQAIDPDLAAAVNQVLQAPYSPGGTAAPAKVPGVTMAGKTGTIDNRETVWTMGYTSTLVGAAMLSVDVSDPYWKTHKRTLQGVRLPASGTYIGGTSGDDAGRRFLKPVFSAAISTRDKGQFQAPSPQIMAGQQVDIPGCAGYSASSCSAMLSSKGFMVSQSSVNSDFPAGVVVGTSPSYHTASHGGVTILVSNGTPVPVTTPTPAPPGQVVLPGTTGTNG